jgi:hypothetical protein
MSKQISKKKLTNVLFCSNWRSEYIRFIQYKIPRIHKFEIKKSALGADFNITTNKTSKTDELLSEDDYVTTG